MITNVHFQSNDSNRLETIGAATIEPMAAPELKIPCAKPRSLIGNHSALFFTAPGQFPASATPNKPLNIPREAAPFAKKWRTEANDQKKIDSTKPILVPTLSYNFPDINFPAA